MTALKAHEVARFLARPDLREGIFLAYGSDPGLVHETAVTLSRRLAEDGPAEIVVLDGQELDADPSRLAVAARTGSLFGEKRIIRVRGAGKSLVMTLSELRDDPGGAAIVLEAGNLTPKDALRGLVEGAKLGRALPCYPDTEETLAALVRDTFAKAGIAADPEAMATLRDILGNDREITRRELDKLVLFAQSGKRLTRADILALCADNAALAIDEIIDATGTGHAQKLEAALDRALANAIDAQRLFSVTQGHFGALRRLRIEVDRGRPARDVLDAMRPRPHFSRRGAMEQQLRLWSDEALSQATERLLAATAESRRRPALAESLLRRTLLALAMQVATH